MRKFRIILFELSLIILLLACSNVSRIILADEDKVSIAWDQVKTTSDHRDIPEGHEVRYLVFIDYSDRHEWVLVEKYVDDILVNKETPIAETSCTIRFKDKGQFVIGVQSVLYDEQEKIKEYSAIAWSYDNRRTNNNPFVIQVGR